MSKRTFIPALFAVLALLCGCANTVSYDLSGRYGEFRPYTIAVLPPVFDEGVQEDRVAGDLLRKMVFEKLKLRGYGALPLEEVDAAAGKEGVLLKGKDPGEAARLLNADAALYIRITGWESRLFVTYASIKLESVFELYASRGQERLWRASYAVKESDIRLDRESMELAVIKAYEPMIERFTDAVMRTLPPAEPGVRERKFFDWLP